MIDTTIRGLDEVNSYLDQLPGNLFEDAKTIYRKSVINATNKIKKNATTSLKVRTGTLRRSIQQQVKGDNLNNLKASVFSASRVDGEELKYAPIHEFGGTIKAKKAYRNVPGGPYLNIPGQQNKTAAGVQRMTAKMVFDRGGFIMGRTVMRGGSDTKRAYDVMFYLTKSVTIKPRLGMIDAAHDEIPNILSEFAKLDLN